ncbi:MAG TPA: UxaA family hydrolase [Tepidisphaeraceae bacterium]|nr:UxaA family hydrolase [Tepidisphaeraceae bacterium]
MTPNYPSAPDSGKRCFQVHPSDNVAVLLEDTPAGIVKVLGEGTGTLEAKEQISLGHKIAVAPIARGAAVVKFGVPIGIATRDISQGEWVHLHNCRSRVDERSSKFDLVTGGAKDTPYE